MKISLKVPIREQVEQTCRQWQKTHLSVSVEEVKKWKPFRKAIQKRANQEALKKFQRMISSGEDG